LAAVARIITGYPDGLALLERWALGPPGELPKRLAATLDGSRDDYWSHHVSVGGKRSAAALALIGAERWDAIALNLVIPMAAAAGVDPALVNRLLEHLRPEPLNQITRQTAFYLFGPDHPSALVAPANRRQGLQQVFHDYCLNDRSRCHACAFPGWLKGRMACIPR